MRDSKIVHRLEMHRITLQVRLPRALPLKIWIATKLIQGAALVLGTGLDISAEGEKDEHAE